MSSGRATTLVSIADEVKEQPSLLRSFQRSSLPPELTETKEEEEEEEEGAAAAAAAAAAARSILVVGAGDSYAASLCTSFLAGPRVMALDPYSLAESIEWARGKSVCIISVSGETRSNVELASALRGVATRTVAITSNPRSRLAGAVDVVVELPFRPRAKSPGIASFTLSLAAALKVCGVLGPDLKFQGLLSRATFCSREILIATRSGGVTHFAGNNEAYGASVYGVAKIYELLGGRAQASLLEEFSHTSLFSLSASDRINVIESPSGRKGEPLSRMLGDAGYVSSLVRPEGGGRVERLYVLIFAMQIAAIEAARRSRGKRSTPFFLGAKKKLRISDEMIY